MSLEVLHHSPLKKGNKSPETRGYVEVELDSSRATTFTSERFANEMDPVTLKLKFQQSGCGTIELPMEGKECFEKSIGQLKKEQFSAQERSNITLVHDGVKLSDNERIVDLLTPS